MPSIWLGRNGVETEAMNREDCIDNEKQAAMMLAGAARFQHCARRNTGLPNWTTTATPR